MLGALFPGQGSQAVGMGRFLFDEFAIARTLFEEASDTLKVNFKSLCFDGPESDLQLTENTQPALLLVSTVSFKVLNSLMPLDIKVAAGHSIGEYSALVASDVLAFSDALRAVRRRGFEMQKAVPVGEGAMCAVLGLSDVIVEKMVAKVQEISGFKPLQAANFNAPGQVVVSGSAKAVEWMRNNVKAEWMAENFGVEAGKPKFIPLAVSAPFHCAMMAPAQTAMDHFLSGLRFAKPRFSVVQNLKAESSSDPTQIREWLVGQVSGSVRWTECQSAMIARGAHEYIEFGHGKVLAGLAKKIASLHPGIEVKVHGLNSLDDLKAIEASRTAAALTSV